MQGKSSKDRQCIVQQANYIHVWAGRVNDKVIWFFFVLHVSAKTINREERDNEWYDSEKMIRIGKIGDRKQEQRER